MAKPENGITDTKISATEEPKLSRRTKDNA